MCALVVLCVLEGQQMSGQGELQAVRNRLACVLATSSSPPRAASKCPERLSTLQPPALAFKDTWDCWSILLRASMSETLLPTKVEGRVVM